ncbi:MAG: phosphotriesterase family protein [Candidatus Dormibacteraceae bacterium]
MVNLREGVAAVLNLTRMGLADKGLLSHDVCLRSHLSICGGCSYDFIPTQLLPRLRKAGLTESGFGSDGGEMTRSPCLSLRTHGVH